MFKNKKGKTRRLEGLDCSKIVGKMTLDFISLFAKKLQ